MPDPIVATPPSATPPAAPAPAAAQPAPAAKPTAISPAAAPAPALRQPAAPAPAAPPATPKAADTVPLAVLMEERDKRQALQSELEQLRNTVNRQQQIPQMGAPQQPVGPNMKEEMDKLWQTDPRAAVERTVMLAAQWQDNINAQVDGEAAGLATKYTDFNDYRDTAMRYVRALPLDQRARPGIVEMAYLVTRGQNVDTIIERQRADMARQFQQNPASFQMPPGAGAPAIDSSNQVQATDAEARAARAMKIPIDQYLRWKK